MRQLATSPVLKRGMRARLLRASAAPRRLAPAAGLPLAAARAPRRPLCTAPAAGGPAESEQEPTLLDRHLRSKIGVHGPVPLSDFMQEALTAPLGGYYTEAGAEGASAVFGGGGDFITAPEISQVT